MSRKDDPAYTYIDSDKGFPGRGMIAAGIIPWGMYWLSAQVVQWNQVPSTIGIGLWTLLAASTLVYLMGYWRALEAKGYPRILFLVAFTGIIGTIVILFLPDKSEQPNADNHLLSKSQ